MKSREDLLLAALFVGMTGLLILLWQLGVTGEW